MPQTLQVVSTVNSWIPPPISEIPSEATRTARMIQSKRNEIVSLLSTPETLSPLYTVYELAVQPTKAHLAGVLLVLL